MHVFRTYRTKTDPKTGKRVQALDKNGRKIPHNRWRFEYTDYLGKRHTATGFSSKEETRKLALQIQSEQDAIRKGYRPVPNPADKHSKRSFSEVTEEYLAWGNSQGGRGGRPWGEGHAKMRKSHLNWWQEKLETETLKDLNGILGRVEQALRDLQGAGRSGKTLQNYREALCAFCHWATARGYLNDNPLKGSESYDTTPKSKRRALTREEIQRLLSVTPAPRCLVYEVALTTGLRAKELRSLKVADLNKELHALNLHAEWTKNRKPGIQPLPMALFERLEEYTNDMTPDDLLLPVPKWELSNTLARDLKRANIPRCTQEGKIDFHALRVTYITLIVESGTDLKTAQTLARHSTPDMTMNTYARVRRDRLSEVTEQIGEALNLCTSHITGPQPKAMHLKSALKSNSYMASPTRL